MGDRLDRGDGARVPDGPDRSEGPRLIEGRFRSYEEKAARMLAGRERAPVDPPAEDERAPERRDTLPEAERAVIDPRKLHSYSMDPGHPAHRDSKSGSKWEAWRDLGYDLDDPTARERAAEEVITHVRNQLPDTEAAFDRLSSWGPRYTTQMPYRGPNGESATIRCTWQVAASGGPPALITIRAELHTERGRQRQEGES